MSKLKKILLTALTICAVGCTVAGLSACAEKKDFPDFREPASYVPPSDTGTDEFNGNYSVYVTSIGGTRLSGVKVDIKRSGETLISTMSQNGLISFNLEPDEYELVVDRSTLPAGYFIDGENVKTSALNGNARILVNSKVQSTTAVSSYKYSVGDVMYDFSYTGSDGNRYTLSQFLNGDDAYKAVVLNFWYIDCSPCRQEFPAINTATEAYKDTVKFIAFDKDDSAKAIKEFKESNGYSFEMVQDVGGVLSTQFGVTRNPTTVVIDRFGVYSYHDTGTVPDAAVWRQLFEKFVSDSYMQDATKPGKPDDNPDIPPDSQPDIPDIAEDNYDNFKQALSGGNSKIVSFSGAVSENDKIYNWPWLLHTDERTGRKYVSTTNAGHGNSFAILTAIINLESGDYISYDYFTSTEALASGGDILYVLLDGEIIAEHKGISADDTSSDEYGWIRSRGAYIATRSKTVTLSLCYLKDEMENAGEDYVAVSNITISNISSAQEAIDVVTDTSVGELTEGAARYPEYVETVFNEQDNYYYVLENQKECMLFLNLNKPALFADLHFGSDKFTPHEYPQETEASLYNLIYWDYTNWKTQSDTQEFCLKFGGNNAATLTDVYLTAYYASTFSPTQLVPVTEEIRTLITEFTREYCEVENIEYYEEMWLEFCCYYRHYGPAHSAGDKCLTAYDPIPGMGFNNAYDAYIGKNTANVWNISSYNGGGVLLKYVPEKTGVYYFLSTARDAGDDPALTLYNSSKQRIAQFENLVSYDMFLRGNIYNFEGYAELVAGETYYMRVNKGFQETGFVDFTIEYVGEQAHLLRVATLDDGFWTYNPDEGINFAYYIAVKTVFNEDDGYYHAVDTDGNIGSVIYIDFIHPNYFATNDNTLLEMIEDGYFDFSSSFGPDYTSQMMQFYYKSIEGKTADDETYGMLEASSELVNYLARFMDRLTGEPNSLINGRWLSIACYYVHYGV